MRVLRIIGFVCAFVPSLLLADNELLSFRLNPAGDLEAIVSGLANYCSTRQFNDATSVTESGMDIAITSPDIGYLCGVPPPAGYYQVVANLGAPDPSRTYRVTWTQGPTALTGQVTPSALVAPTINYTALWWNSAEPGWGVNINHQDDTLFLTMFSYGPDGTPMWLVAPNMALLVDGSFYGALYRLDRGSPFAAPWVQAKDVIALGAATVRFSTDHTGTLTLVYETDGVGEPPTGSRVLTKSIEKEIFGPATTCNQGKGSRASLTNYQDVWWSPAEPGWGLSVAQQGSTILAVLFTFDANGHDTWFVGPNLARQADGTFTGALYSSKGPAFDASPWSAITANQAGTMSLAFSDGETGTLNYTVNGAAVTKPIQREVAGSILPRCQ